MKTQTEKTKVKLKAMLCMALLFLALPMMAQTYHVTLNKDGNGSFRYRIRTGSSWGSWSTYLTTTTVVDLTYSQHIHIQAKPDADNYFVNWTDSNDVGNYRYSFQFIVRDDFEYTCHFTDAYRTIHATSQGPTDNPYATITAWGPFATTTMTSEGIKVGVGATCVLTATGRDGYALNAWRENNSSGDVISHFPDYYYVVAENRTFYANMTTSWDGDLENGATYTLTSSNPDNYEFQVTCSNTSSPYHNKTYRTLGAINVPANKTCTIILNNDKTIQQKKTVTVGQNANLTIQPTGANRSIYRYWFNGTMFDATAAGSTLNIGDASSSQYVVIWGGANFKNKENSSMWDARGYDQPDGYGELTQEQRGIGTIIRSNATLVLNKVYLRGSFNDGSAPLVNGSNYPKTGGAIYVSNNTDTKYDLTLKNVNIQGCYATAGAALYLASSDYHTATLEYVTISGCYANGDEYSEGDSPGAGIIRTNGSVRTDLTLKHCTLTKNKTTIGGGAITWNAGGETTTKIRLEDCELSYNEAYNGGGASLTGIVELERTLIHHNKAIDGIGGGLYTATYGASGITEDGSWQFSGNPTRLVIGTDTKLYYNEAKDGGGICYNIKPSAAIGFDPAGDTLTAYFMVEVNGGEIYNNTATRYGGGVCIFDEAARRQRNCAPYQNDGLPNPAYGKISGLFVRGFKITNGKVYGNSVSSSGVGGGIYIRKSKNNNIANGRYTYYEGSVLKTFDYEDPDLGYPSAGTLNVDLSGGEIYNNTNNTGNGGGLALINTSYEGSALPAGYVSEVNAIVTGSFELYDNTASKNGGGMYIDGGNFRIENGQIGKENHPNISNGGNGGAVYVGGGNFIMSGGTIAYNQAKKVGNTGGNGGGFYVTGGTVEIKGGTITENEADVNAGGFYVNTSKATDIVKINSEVAATTISNNHAQSGGGTYIGLGILEIKDAGTQIIGNEADTNGGGICGMGGTIYIEDNATISGNEAVNGGGIYAMADISLTSGSINNNQATYGGGLFIPNCTATLNFSSGTFNGNYASSQGGGIYISDGATLNLQGVAMLTGNHVPATGKGGGIYMNGTLYVGGGTGTQSMKCYDNYAGASFSTATQNNVYLPSNAKYITLKSDISHKTGGVYDTQIGITVNPEISGGMRPVVHVEDPDNESWLNALMADIATAGGAVFDDSQHYIAIHTRSNLGAFNLQYIYFHDCWTTVVTTDPGESHIKLIGDVYHIYTNQGLAWFSSLVNGLNKGAAAPANTFTTPQRGLNAVLEADIDMGANLWVPLGAISAYNPSSSSFTESSTDSYTGIFDGQGHVIIGISNGYLTGIERYGLFGASSGTLKNIFIDNITNIAVDPNHQYYMGGITGACKGGTISNCEVRGNMDLTMVHPSATSYAGGIAGVVYSDSDANIHSCMAIPDIRTGNRKVFAGGLVGALGTTNSLKNSIANVIQIANGEVTPHADRRTSCLVGENKGVIENCYVRLQMTTGPVGQFGWFAGYNSGTISTCYIPSYYHLTGVTDNANTGTTYDYTYDGTGSVANPGKYNQCEHYGRKYGFAHWDEAVTGGYPGYVDGPIDSEGNLKGLLGILNAWVDDQPSDFNYSRWMRTMATNMNADFPILEFNDFNCVGSKDCMFLYYEDNVNDLWTEKGFDTVTATYNPYAAMYLYAPQPVLPGQTLPDPVTITGNTAVPLHIKEDIGITQAMGNALTARVGVTLDNSSVHNGTPTFMAYDWHMFSSALRSAPMGLVYHSGEGDYYVRENYSTLLANGISDSDYTSAMKIDPPQTTWNETVGSTGYFPTNTPYGPWRGTGSLDQGFDFYCYDEPTRHWINYKREGALAATSSTGYDFFDHWSTYIEDPAVDKHENIPYVNDITMAAGKGYMVAVSQPSMLMADGELNNAATQTYNATFTEQGYGGTYDYPFRGVNLVGNPYQSYLDFNLFANDNPSINTYYILDADQKGYIAYTNGSTPQEEDWLDGVKSYTASRYIHPHQGFIVLVSAPTTLNFTSTMRLAGDNTSVGSDYRDWEPRYPLINMICSDTEGRNDFATVELDRPEVGGGKKVKGLRTGDASIWFRLEQEDYQIAFAPVGTQSIPLRFKAHADGVYTLRWNMQNADFGYLHLIDNLTGVDVDCLSATEYRFEGKADDYTSRFRLMFDFTGIDEPEEDNPSAGSGSFAFIMNDELVVSGEGLLQVFDITGRQLMSTEVHGEQSTVSLPKAASGVYVLRLTSNKCVRTQKMVINQ